MFYRIFKYLSVNGVNHNGFVYIKSKVFYVILSYIVMKVFINCYYREIACLTCIVTKHTSSLNSSEPLKS